MFKRISKLFRISQTQPIGIDGAPVIIKIPIENVGEILIGPTTDKKAKEWLHKTGFIKNTYGQWFPNASTKRLGITIGDTTHGYRVRDDEITILNINFAFKDIDRASLQTELDWAWS